MKNKNEMAKRERRLIPKSRLIEGKIDSVQRQKMMTDRYAFDLLMEGQQYWDNMEKFRRDRNRNKRYVYGDQWSDRIEVDHKMITEEEYIKSQGNVPLKNNLIRRLVRNVIGVYRQQSKEPVCTARDRDEQQLGEMMTNALQYNWQLNRMGEMNARTFEEFLISGVAVQKETWGWRNDKMECWTDYVNPNTVFFDTSMKDFRHWDVSVIGEIHDITFGELCHTFARSEKDYQRLSEIYRYAANNRFVQGYVEDFGRYRLSNVDFLCPRDPSLCRVIEIWKKEQKKRYRCHDLLNGDYYKIEIKDKAVMVDAENESRIQEGLAAGMPMEEIPLIEAEWFVDSYWYYRFLTPFGQVLCEGETPYEHKSHPYVFKIYPFIDGEVHSFTSDFIDQQRYVNRLITLNDWMIRATAKGVLLFPEELLPDDKTLEDIAEEWTRFDGLIAIKTTGANTSMMPQQIVNNSTHVGVYELLNLQMKLMEDISGVNGALQGKPGYSGTSAALYSQQTQNATTSLLDLLEAYSCFVVEGATKKVKNIQQFYTDRRMLNITGKNRPVEYDPKKVQDTEFDLSITESAATPVSRMVANDFLMEIWKSGQISVEQLLEFGNFPFADDLLQSLKSQDEQLKAGQVPAGLPPAVLQQIQQSGNPQNTAAAQQMLAG